MNYWEECIKESFEDAGITATKEQINTVASWVEGADENHSLATGHDCIPNPLVTENERLVKRLEDERDRITREFDKEIDDKNYVLRRKNRTISNLMDRLEEAEKV